MHALPLFAALVLSLTAQDEGIAKFGTTVVISGGLEGRIYRVGKLTKKLPDLSKRKPAGTIYTTSLNVPPTDFREGFPGVTNRFEFFAIGYTGKFWIENPGEYRFALTSDDGSKLSIDDELLIDNDGLHPPQERQATVQLSKGVHHLHLDYFQGPRFHVALILKIARPGGDFRVFNTSEFSPPPDWHH